MKDRIEDFARETKQRAELLDERVPNLFKRYPLVGLVVFAVGVGVGALAVWVF